MNKKQSEQFKRTLNEEGFLPWKPAKSLEALTIACNHIVRHEHAIFYSEFLNPLKEFVLQLYNQGKILNRGEYENYCGKFSEVSDIAEEERRLQGEIEKRFPNHIHILWSDRPPELRELNLRQREIRDISKYVQGLPKTYLTNLRELNSGHFKIETVRQILKRYFKMKEIDRLSFSSDPEVENEFYRPRKRYYGKEPTGKIKMSRTLISYDSLTSAYQFVEDNIDMRTKIGRNIVVPIRLK